MPLHNHPACRRLSVLILVVMLFSCATAAAQWMDHRGKEFRIAFLQSDGADDAPILGLSIACDKPTTGTITYVNSNPLKVQISLYPTVPSS
jgi:hypothetical protein